MVDGRGSWGTTVSVRPPALVAAIGTLLCLLGSSGAGAASLEPVGDFDSPIFITSPPADPDRLLVVEREGVVQEKRPGKASAPFADLTALVECCESERGLLSIALAPDFPTSDRFYAAYTGNTAAGGAVGDIHVDAFRDQEGSLVREAILTVAHSLNKNHNGGQLQFGPDGGLFISVGDGGGGGDPFDAGQNLDTLLGKLLRIEPRPGELDPYSIPADNPFVGTAGRDEIWAYGLRNPWRFSFDRQSGDLIVADVGQGVREEVNFAPSPVSGAVGGAGANYGWDCREGLIEYSGPSSDACDGADDFTDPVFDYPHVDPEGGGAFGCSITGGYVVRDSSLDDLFGRYVYADFCQGQIRSLLLPDGGGAATDDRAAGLAVANPTSFGEDSCGRLYVASNEGTVHRLVGDQPADCGAEPEPEPEPEPGPGPGTQPEPGLLVPGTSPSLLVQPRTRPRAVPRLLIRAADAGKRSVHITVRVRPCAGNAGKRVLLKRGGRRLAARRLNRSCIARFRARIRGRSTFRAVLPLQHGTLRSRRLSRAPAGSAGSRDT